MIKKISFGAVFIAFLFIGANHGILAARAADSTISSITAADLGVTDVGTLPSSRWYFWKEWRRGVEQFFTFNSVKKAELELRITNEKAAEILKVQEVEPENTEALAKALENYENAGERLRVRIANLKETSENPNVEKLLEKLNERTAQHVALLGEIAERYDTDPYSEDVGKVNPKATRDNFLQGAADMMQKKIQDIVLAGAEKEKNIEQKASEQIKAAEAAIVELKAALAELAKGPVRIDSTPARISTNLTIERQTPKRDFGDRMKAGLETAAGVLANGKTLFAEGKFGEAFGKARTAEVFARNAVRMIENILRPDQGGLEDGDMVPKSSAPDLQSATQRGNEPGSPSRLRKPNSVQTVPPKTGGVGIETFPEFQVEILSETKQGSSE